MADQHQVTEEIVIVVSSTDDRLSPVTACIDPRKNCRTITRQLLQDLGEDQFLKPPGATGENTHSHAGYLGTIDLTLQGVQVECDCYNRQRYCVVESDSSPMTIEQSACQKDHGHDGALLTWAITGGKKGCSAFTSAAPSQTS